LKYGKKHNMSRLAKKTISLPQGISLTKQDNKWVFHGPKGDVSCEFPQSIFIKQSQDGIAVLLAKSFSARDKKNLAMLGTAVSLIRNAIRGAGEFFEKKLELEGIGYKVQLDGKNLVLSLGFTHPVRIEAPAGISFSVDKNLIKVQGVDKALVGKIAAEIRAQKKPEPYKGKGIHYVGEVIRRKAGKKAVGTV